MRPHPPPTRRTVLAGAGVAVTLAVLGTPARSQPDGFRLIRARDGGYDGTIPGPVLRVKRGEELKVRLVNELSVETAIHWHGVRVPNGMDGTSLTQNRVAPSAHFDYRFTPPDAGTFWYRPPLRFAWNRAPHGLLIVDEAEPVDVDRDVALVLDAPPPGADGAPRFTVNGLPSLDIPVAANERIRLRLLNAADSRLITLRIDRHPVTVMAIDGQPAEPFMAREGRITLSPGNRADVFVDTVLEPGGVAPIVVQNDGVDVPLARFVYDATKPARPSPRPEAKPLPPNPLPARMDFRSALRVDLDPNAGDVGVPLKPLFSVRRGRTVQLAIKNGAAHAVVLHIHGHHVRLLDALDDGWKPFWLDTILCVPQATTRVAFVADNAGKWLLRARPIGRDTQSLEWFEVT